MTKPLLLSALALLGPAAPFPTRQSPPLEAVAWMAGCWERRSTEGLTEEQWMAPRGSVMLGMSRTLVRGEVRDWEHGMIRVDGSRLVFGARPAGQEPADFTSTEIAPGRVVFANPDHDFPQTVAYRTAAAGDSLVATISGPSTSGTDSIVFRYGRAVCPR